MILDDPPTIRTTKSGHKIKMVRVRCDFCLSVNLRSLSFYKKRSEHRCRPCSAKFNRPSHRKGVEPSNKQIRCLVSCLWCGVEKLKTKRNLTMYPKTFCDSSCQNKWQNKFTDFNKGAKNPAFRHGERVGGRSPTYGKEFDKQLKRAIKTRDGYKCVDCCASFSGQKSFKLDVHHVDGDKMNNSELNLVSLCKSCHSRRHWAQLGKRKQLKGNT